MTYLPLTLSGIDVNLRNLNAKARTRFKVARSAIHGWGLFVKEPISKVRRDGTPPARSAAPESARAHARSHARARIRARTHARRERCFSNTKAR